MNIRRLIGLCLVPVLLAVLDGSVTLVGQPAAYWAGDHSRVLEGTPGFRILLAHGPAAYIVGLSVWVLAFVGLIPSTAFDDGTGRLPHVYTGTYDWRVLLDKPVSLSART